MEPTQLSPLNQSMLVNKAPSPQPAEVQPAPEPVKDGNKKMRYALYGLAAAGVAAIGIGAAIKHGKTVKLSEISFDKGVASLKDGSKKFSGTISDTLKNGDKIKMTYQDGVLQKSVRKGKVSFTKEYQYVDGAISKVVKNGKEIDIQKLAAEGKEKAESAAKEAAQAAADETSKVPQKSLKEIQEEIEQISKEASPEYIEGVKLGENFASEAENAQEALEKTRADAALEAATGKKAAYSSDDIAESKKAFEKHFAQQDKIAYQEQRAAKLLKAQNRSGDIKVRIADIVKEKEKGFKFSAAAKKRYNVLKQLDPEIIKALSDEQIDSLLTSYKTEEFSKVTSLLKDNFSPDEIREISTGMYSGVFIQNLFDAANSTADEALKTLSWYKK